MRIIPRGRQSLEEIVALEVGGHERDVIAGKPGLIERRDLQRLRHGQIDFEETQLFLTHRAEGARVIARPPLHLHARLRNPDPATDHNLVVGKDQSAHDQQRQERNLDRQVDQKCKDSRSSQS